MKKKIEIALHLLIIVTTFLAIGVYFIPSLNPLGDKGFGCFKYFTTDSNVIAMIASIFSLISILKNKQYKWVNIFQFIATVSVTLTLLTVIFFLSPMNVMKAGIRGYFVFFEKEVFVLHFSTPILSIIALLISDNEYNKNICYFSLLPTILYSIIYIINVVFTGLWYDWYGFTFGGNYYLTPLIIIIMYSITYLIALVEYKIHNYILNRK